MHKTMFGLSGSFSPVCLFEAGVGQVEITPTENPLPALMGGATALPAEFVDLPLYVKAAVISDGERKVAMVTLDILKYPSVQTELAAERIEQATGIPAEYVTITSSHTHSGPLSQYYLDESNGSDRLIDAIVAAVKAADKDLEPCGLGAVETEVADICFNRRLLLEGEVWNYWLVKPPELRDALPASGAVDFGLQALVAVTEDGKYKAILWNYACHPNANRKPAISADFPGFVQQFLNEKLGYETTALFLPGASADINPRGTPETIGLTIADKLLESLTTVRYIGEPVLSVERRTLQIPGREEPVFAEEEIAAKWPGMLEAYRESFRSTRLTASAVYPAHLTGIRIGEHFAIVTSPGELFADIGLDIKRRSPISRTMTVQQTNGALGYIPAAKDFGLKGYEIWYGEHSNLSVKAGESIEDESLRILKRLKTESPAT